MKDLIEQLKKDIIEELNLGGKTPADIDNDEPLFGGNLPLDSIDALTLVVILERKYGKKIEDPDEGKKVLYSINTIVEYITG
jgi:acyl carrier protein